VIESVQSIQPLLALSCPALGSILIVLSKKRPNLRESWTLLASLGQFLLILTLIPTVLSRGWVEWRFFTIFPGVDFVLRIDAFGLLFGLTSSFLWILVSVYSIGYLRTLGEHAQTRYYCCFSLAILGAVGVAFSGNLVTLYIFYELLTISTYPLVSHEQTTEALFAGRKYLVYLLTAGCFLLAAVAWTYSMAGGTDFLPGGILSTSTASRTSLEVLFFLFLLGFMKAAYMPFHAWLPSAMVAPSPVSALLHAVAVVKAGVFGVVRTVGYIFGPTLMQDLGLGTILSVIAAFTMILASLFAIAQDNLKRRLAYSTISQLAYILFGAGLLTSSGFKGAMIHIPFHGLMKITLFLCAGSILVASGKKNISEMGGIGRSMPITMGAFTICALGMSGVPLTAGFISKWFLGLGTVQAGQFGLLAVLLISSLLDVVYLFPIVHRAFFGSSDPPSAATEGKNLREAPWTLTIPLSVTAVLSVLFYFPNPLSEIVHRLVGMAVSRLGLG
jgi:multicomponent Na+:H+ antiporter subunit D